MNNTKNSSIPLPRLPASAQRCRQLQRLGVRAVAAAVAALLPGS